MWVDIQICETFATEMENLESEYTGSKIYFLKKNDLIFCENSKSMEKILFVIKIYADNLRIVS